MYTVTWKFVWTHHTHGVYLLELFDRDTSIEDEYKKLFCLRHDEKRKFVSRRANRKYF